MKDSLAGSASLIWSADLPMGQWEGVTFSFSPNRRVQEIRLVNRGLTGCLPARSGELTGLTQPELCDNGLSGEIPSQLGRLSSLTQRHLDDIELSGAIPTELGDLSTLIV